MAETVMLSTDLVFEILDCLAIPMSLHQRCCDFAVLAACSLVCKIWSARAQRLLFRRVLLPHNIYREPYRRATSPNSLPSFLSAIGPDTERGRWLAESVLSLTVRHTGREMISNPAGLATVLLRTPNLRHLDVTTISCDFDHETLELLRAEGPRITSLSILRDFSPSPAQHTRIMHQLVASFPSVRLLEITTDLSSLPPFEPPLSLSLASVKFNTPMVADIGPCLASLLNPTEDGEPLQLLWHKSQGGHPTALGDVLRVYGPHLRSLSIKTLDEPQTAFLSLCTRLERFEFGRFPNSAALAAIPRTIKALAISHEPDSRPGVIGTLSIGVERLTEALKTFPLLEVLTWSFCPNHPLVVRLRTVCVERGIELRTSATELTDDNAIELELRRKHIRI
ncbi:hypothetical protein B0H10DRAFT_11238 [Mycena sp. CBHHK59/15]|nr:hypothetical protein B0H10DRAFT_11238 [Mycena sp. CBHHK59/15]